MTSEPRRDPLIGHLLAPENSALVIIGFQPTQVVSVRPMDTSSNGEERRLARQDR